MLPVFAVVIAAYLIGSISFAVLSSRLFRLPDPHSYGSGNLGATNVLRTGNKAAAAMTLVGDGAKGALAVWLAQRFAVPSDVAGWTVAAAALGVFAGHLYPVFHRFAGGKGVSTGAGIVFALHWGLALVLVSVWIAVAYAFRISSVAALSATALLPAGMFYLFGNAPTAWAALVICVLSFWRHRGNIRKLIAGTEPTIGH